jgi:hypothetical protein
MHKSVFGKASLFCLCWMMALPTHRATPGLPGLETGLAQDTQRHQAIAQIDPSMVNESTAAPDWAVEQLLLRDYVKQFLYEAMKWQSADGYITDGIHKWKIDDKPQLFLNWISYYLLTGDEKVYESLKKSVFLYLNVSKEKLDHGYFKNAAPNTEYALGALIMLANLAYAKPNDAAVAAALGDIVEHCGNFVAGYEPWFNTATKHLRSVQPGTREIIATCNTGVDWPFNLRFAKMALAYYHSSGDVRYLNWCKDYLDGWMASLERNNRENGVFLLPWEVNPSTGALGSCSGKWWEHAATPYWGWEYGSLASAEDMRGAFLDFFRLTGQRPYLDAIKRQINFTFTHSNNFAPAIWYEAGRWVNDNRSFCATPIAVSVSLQDTELDPQYENRLLTWFQKVDAPTLEQYFWHFRRSGDYRSMLTIIKRTAVLAQENMIEFKSLVAITKPDRFPDLEGMEGLTMSAFGGLPSGQGELPWTEVMYFKNDNTLGLEEGVASVVESANDSGRVIALYNTTNQPKTIKLQADYLPKIIKTLTLNNDSPVKVGTILAAVILPPLQLTRVSLQIADGDTVPPGSPINLRVQNAAENSIRFVWDAPKISADGETVAAYLIKRDGQEIARQDSLSFTDSGLLDGTAYRYEVFSLDALGNRSQPAATAQFSTKLDVVPPTLLSATLSDSIYLRIQFDEPLSATSACQTNHYTIVPALAVQEATLSTDKKIVTLHTRSHHPGVRYTLTVNNLQDASKSQNVMISAQKSYHYLIPFKITNIQPMHYLVRTTVAADSVYCDRDYRFQQIPEKFLNQPRLMTANSDKSQTGNAFLTFTLNQSAAIYVAYDQDLATMPGWLLLWGKTPLVVKTNDSGFLCYQKIFPPGQVTLGGNAGVGSNSMYLVFIEPQSVDLPPLPPQGLTVLPWVEK